MEANFFRFALQELRDKAIGLRLQKIFTPEYKCWTLDLGKAGYVIWKSSPRGGFFLLSREKPENPRVPPGSVMQLRKRACGRRIKEVRSAWPERKGAFELSGYPREYLVLDLCQGVCMQSQLDEDFARGVEWPELPRVFSEDEIWRRYPQLSPPLRKELQNRTYPEAENLYALMLSGQPEGFYCSLRGEKEELLPWRPSISSSLQEFSSALQAAEASGAPHIDFARSADPEADKEASRQRKKLVRNMQKLEEDEKRLQEMVQEGEKARLIQNNLFQLPKNEKREEVGLWDESGQWTVLGLNARLTVRENMEYMFERERKGRRGLDFVSSRRSMLQKRLEDADYTQPRQKSNKRQKVAGYDTLPRKYRNLAVHVFTSDDGFLLLRGKNNRANHELLSRAANPFDLWFHVRDGPGAHVVLKRDHPHQGVPERTLHQAAALAGLASYQKHADRAEVTCAVVRDVRKIKGAALGEVVVDSIRETILATIPSDLESRLKIA